MKLVHWPLMGGLLHLVQRWGKRAGSQPAQVPHRCTKCNSPPINGSVPIAVLQYNSPLLGSFNMGVKGLKALALRVWPWLYHYPKSVLKYNKIETDLLSTSLHCSSYVAEITDGVISYVTTSSHWTVFMITGLDRTYHAHQFIFSFFYRVVDWAGYPSAFYCTLNTQYRIVSYHVKMPQPYTAFAFCPLCIT